MDINPEGSYFLRKIQSVGVPAGLEPAPLILVDARVSERPPGTLHHEKWQSGALAPRGVERASSHGFGVRELLEMAAVLGKLPARVQLVGIEIASTAPGRGLSPEVERAVERAVAGVVAMLVGKMKSGKDY